VEAQGLKAIGKAAASASLVKTQDGLTTQPPQLCVDSGTLTCKNANLLTKPPISLEVCKQKWQ